MINLDAMATVKESRDIAEVLSQLVRYAHMKAQSIQWRTMEGGSVNDAIDLERNMNIIYSSLPEWVKW